MPLFGEIGARIGYVVHEGPPAAPPLFLLHGFTASSSAFASNVAGLAERFTVVTLELLGHGESDAPDDPAFYAVAPAVERILGLFEYLGCDRVLLCGHSLGAALALRVALAAPEHFAGLILMNSMSAAGDAAWRAAAWPRMREMARRVRADGVDIIKHTSLYPGRSRRLPEEAKQLLVRDFERLTPQGVAGTAEALVIEVNAAEQLGDLQVPTLVIIGDRDTDFAQQAPAFLARLPADLVRTAVIEGAGHAANIEQPDVFNDAVTRFAESLGYLPPRPSSVGLASRAPYVIGGALVVAGVALLAAAAMVSREGGASVPSQPVAAPTAVAVAASSMPPTPAEAVSGVRTAGPGAPAPAGSVSSPVASPTATAPAAATAASPTATQRPATPAPTSTSVPPTATEPPPSPTPPPTATPAAPYAGIGGPASAAPGQAAIFTDASPPGHATVEWSFLGRTVRHDSAVSVTFPAAGCYPITLTAYFPAPAGAKTATKTVAVGGATCP